MEFGLKEILILVGFIIVAGILLDGYRRMQRARQGSLQPGQPMGSSQESDWEYLKGELPNGGARVVKLGSATEGEGDDPELGDLAAGHWGSALDQPEEPVAQTAEQANEAEQTNEKEEQSDLFADDELLMAARAEQQARLSKATRNREAAPPPSRKKADKAEVADTELAMPTPDFSEVVVINVMARQQDFGGPDLQRVLMSCGFHYGDMKIFHRHEQHSGKGPKLFSIANVVEPGFFDLEQLESFSTPGLCIFMKLPGPKRPLHSFDIMMDCARKIANLLDADIKDEHHNPMRQQTAEHYRQRVLDFERKMLAYQAAQRQH